jgi:hypothetical protein
MKKWLAWVSALGALVLMLLPRATAYAAPTARDCNNAAVWISSPHVGATVSGTFAITGAAALPPGQFRYYEIEYAAVGTDAWAVIVNHVRVRVVNGQLALANADLIQPGDYTFRLLAVDRTGNYCEAFASPVHISSNARGTPMPDASPTPAASPTPNATPTDPAVLMQDVAQASAGTPTLTIQIPTVAPGLDPLLTQGKGAASLLPRLPTAELDSIGAAAIAWTGSLGRAFVFGMQLTAGAFILLGVIVFLRRNL